MMRQLSWKIITNPEMSAADVERALVIIKATDGVDVAKAKADEYLARAREVLPGSLPPAIHEAFVIVADFIGEREF